MKNLPLPVRQPAYYREDVSWLAEKLLEKIVEASRENLERLLTNIALVDIIEKVL